MVESKKKPAAKNADTERLSAIPAYDPKPGESYMNSKQKDYFKKILEDWKQQLIKESSRTVDNMQSESGSFPDPTDRATQEEEFSLELRARDRDRKLLKKINASLLMVEKDEYGYCQECGGEIKIKRLQARPTATMCIDCKTLQEIRERQQL